ncbi:MAG: cation-translocating P-type ATPase, partial [Candidatus Heimdallarchaeota archaeon]|nr:cation-translocating P-type ATPase [Candidatus Heimdallarchaeota archaeon]MCK4877940.1 cation-translocating P-type ATPase [Candidatus Heimdallarchaeota archaeon]
VAKLQMYGPNKITITERFKVLKMIFEQFTSFLVLLLIVAGIISLGIGLNNLYKHGHGEEIIDAIAIFAIVIINAIIGFVQDFRSNQALAKLKEYFEQDVVVIREGKESIIHASDLVPGDVVSLEVGDKIPADCRLIIVNNFKIDEAPLTGESTSITKKLDVVAKEARIHDRKNMIYSGTTCVYGRGRAIVTSTGMKTEMGKIAELTQVKEELTPLQKALDKLGKVLGIVILVICAVVMVVDTLLGESLLESFETAVALAISAVPEGLPAAIVITLAIGVSRMAKKKTIVSKLPAVETLGSVDYICSDKTGTLTRNEMTVKEIWTMDGKTEIGGSGYLLEGEFKRDGKKIDPQKDPILNRLLNVSYNCNNAGILRNEEKIDIKGDPTEAALVVVAEKAGFTKKNLNERDHEIFFDSDRKRMTMINIENSKKIANTKGSPPVVLTRCNTAMIDGKTVKITKELEKQILDANLEMSKKALRVLAIAYRELPDNYNKEKVEEIEDNLIFVGLTGMIDPARPEVKDAIDECRQAGITTVMITGDQEATAIAVAEEIGIIESKEDLIVNGNDFALMSDEELEEKITKIKVYSRMSPKDKFRVVEMLQTKDHIVACTGDGVNDAPAIRKADIGVAMGITGTDVTKEVADMVITDDSFSTIVSAVEEGRNIFENMKKFIRYLLSCNFDEIFAVLIIYSAFGVLAFLPLQILFLNLLTDALPALSLSFDPYDPELMQRPPRGKKSSFVRDMYVFAAIAGTVALIASVSIFLVGLKGHGPDIPVFGEWADAKGLVGTERDDFIYDNVVAYSQMLAFVATLSFELWFVFIARNNNETSFLSSKPFKNKYLLGAVILSWALLLMVIYIPPLQMIFSGFDGYYIMNGRDWGYILGFTIGLCILVEIARYGLRTEAFKKFTAKLKRG